ncbi:MAG TPA: hypothetical protein VFT95_06475 [Micromonosporaceae bacterium]|nr:hypothetical protein [Micromonosporaceae bacterium]
MSDPVRQAREALARADRARAPAARAARRSVRYQFLAMGAATALAILGTGLLSAWGADGIVWPRALVVGVVWAAVFGGASLLVGAQAVHAQPARFRTIVVTLAGAVVTGLTLAVGPDVAAAYPIGAILVMGVWALGAAWVGPPRTGPPRTGPPRTRTP